MKNFKKIECQRQTLLIQESLLFDGCPGGGSFIGKGREFVLQDSKANLYAPIRDEVLNYFEENKISWWGGSEPTGHVLSSQIACLNHLFAIRNDATAVLAILNKIRNEFIEVLPILSDKTPAYIGFEVVSDEQHLNEKTLRRGSYCTSVDACIYAKHKSGQIWLIPIEWKYTEHYQNIDKSKGRGAVRMRLYNDLIRASNQLKKPGKFAGSLYYYEPFYQLMRQTLWAENMILNKEVERLKVDDYLHVNVIPWENDELLLKKYKVSGKGMESSWRSMLSDKSKYVIIDPRELMSPVSDSHPQLSQYLSTRYWNVAN